MDGLWLKVVISLSLIPIAGVGLNVDNDKPTTSLNAALRNLTYDFQLRREDITSVFFNKFEHLFSILMNQGE